MYSLGVVGYELLSGKRPFTGDSSVSIALAHVSNNPPPLSTGISAPTRELISIAMRKDPATRFADGAEFQQAIADARAGRRPTKTFVAATPPQPQASTAELAAVPNGTTHVPALEHAQAPTPAPTKKSGGFGIGVLIALFTLVAILGAVWALTSGALDGLLGTEPTTTSTTSSTTSPSSETLTTEITTVTEPPTTSERTTTSAEPSTLYNTPEPEEPSTPEPEPPYTPAPDSPSQHPTPSPTPYPIPDFNGVPELPGL